jgi:hypothetical protein
MAWLPVRRLIAVARNRPLLSGVGAMAAATVALVVAVPVVRGLVADQWWDFGTAQANPIVAPIGGLLLTLPSQLWLMLAWLAALCLGLWAAHRAGLSSLPLRALLVVGLLVLLAGGAGVPDWARALTAPFYGLVPRIAILGAAPVALFVGLGLTTMLSLVAARGPRLRRLAPAVAVAAAVVVAMPAQQLVSGRRLNLNATLAGAGDTAAVARTLNGWLAPGETVLTLEGDGSEFMYAYARTPVRSDPWLATRLGLVEEPEVARRMAELGVRFIALGTTSLHWGPKPGYSIDRLGQLESLQPVLTGTDVSVLRYEPRS